MQLPNNAQTGKFLVADMASIGKKLMKISAQQECCVGHQLLNQEPQKVIDKMNDLTARIDRRFLFHQPPLTLLHHDCDQVQGTAYFWKVDTSIPRFPLPQA